MFNDMDINGDGSLSHAEFREGLESLNSGFTEEQIQNLLTILDNDDDGTISYDEFMAALDCDPESSTRAADPRSPGVLDGSGRTTSDSRTLSNAPVDFQIVMTGVEFRAMLARKQFRKRQAKKKEMVKKRSEKES